MIGSRVRWRHLNDDGKPAVDLDGVIVAIERGGTPAKWSLLVRESDGTLTEADPGNVIVVESESDDVWQNMRTGLRMFGHELHDDMKPSGECGESCESLAALDKLDGFLDATFPDVENFGGGPIERAEALLSEFKTELLANVATIGEKEAELVTLRKKLSMIEARNKKPEKKDPTP